MSVSSLVLLFGLNLLLLSSTKTACTLFPWFFKGGGAAKTITCLLCFDASIFYASRSLVRMVSSFGDSSSISLLQCLPSRNLSSLRHARSILVVLLFGRLNSILVWKDPHTAKLRLYCDDNCWTNSEEWFAKAFCFRFYLIWTPSWLCFFPTRTVLAGLLKRVNRCKLRIAWTVLLLLVIMGPSGGGLPI